ncbi:DUF2950 family protein [Aestuariivirga sp.]|uniref:DUF2950 family protein n=1 Tax=Aestuariivirga sp. TaxID=2650926 RepID=UPI0035944F36
MQKTFSLALVGAALLFGSVSMPAISLAAEPGVEEYVGEVPTAFANPEDAMAALKAGLDATDVDELAKLLGLEPAKLKSAEGLADRLAEIKDGASELITIESDGDTRIISIGREVWPFPFPVVKGDDGKWSFDTYAGLEEIVNRRVGENELQAIATARLYVEAQRDYAAEDRDEDGVLEFAQKLISSEGTMDGLYWPIEQGDGTSPLGPNLDEAALDKAAQGKGYFGYKYRILQEQGDNVAGGKYNFVINGNMIAGFGLIAYPANYPFSGVSTFVVNHAGIVYEKDLGDDTAAVADKIVSFDPDNTWEVVNEEP